MDYREAIKLKDKIHGLLEQSRINDALNETLDLIDGTGTTLLKEEVEKLKMSYKFMLQYLSRGILDPQRDTVLLHIIESLYSITDRCIVLHQENDSPLLFHTRRRELNGTPLSLVIQQWKQCVHKYDLLQSVPDEQQNKEAIRLQLRECEQCETKLFNKLWSSFSISLDDVALLKELVNDNSTPIHLKCLVLSGLFLGLMTVYDENKVDVLAQTYVLNDNSEVQIRALIYLVLSLYIYNNRVRKSHAIRQHVAQVADMPLFSRDLATLQFLLARSRNTENITRRVRDDLMPGLMNMSPDLLRKIKDKNSPIDMSDLEANPEWQDMLENKGLQKKMEEFNEMQMAGNDVFISTFSHLKSFPFFKTMSNWFLPFHSNHSTVQETFAGSALADIIGEAPLCNSDRYSFCLSMASIPESQRQMMVNQVQAQYHDLKEMKSTELPDTEKQREYIANLHLQDLYRFFKLFSRRREFAPIFDQDMDITKTEVLNPYASKESTISIIAEFYFNNKFYDDAIHHYMLILEGNSNVDPHVFQKLGFCHENLGNTTEALRYYKRYLLAHDDDVWTLKHMAACYRATNRYVKAIECYKKVEQLQPDAVSTVLSIGNCLLELGSVDEALKYYYKADFMNGAKHRAWRPIAWCSFITGNDERALNYYEKIINEDKASAQDYMNRAHVLLCSKHIPEAFDNYNKSLEMESNKQDFRDAFFNDAKHLHDRGVSDDDMALIVDALLNKETI